MNTIHYYLEKGYTPLEALDTRNPPQGGSAVPSIPKPIITIRNLPQNSRKSSKSKNK